MRRTNLETKILITSVIIFLIGIIIFGALWNIDSSWILGWMVGAPASMFGYVFGMLALNLLLKKGTKKKGVVLTYVRLIITFLLQIALFIAIIAVDKNASGIGFWDKDINSLMGPISFFTYLGGVGIIAFSTFVAHFLIKKGR